MPNVDWNQVLSETRETPRMVDPRRRLVVCFLGFILVTGTIFARAAWLEWTEGPKRRELATRPLENRHLLPARRGTIVDRNGVILTEDRPTSALAVRYRYLEDPPNPRWLRSILRVRLTKEQRKDPARVEVEKRQVLKEQQETKTELAKRCGITVAEWDRRAKRIQDDVQRISRSVNLRRMAKYHERQHQRADNPPSRLEQFLSPEVETKPEPILVREELDYHIIAEEVPPEVIQLIRSQPEKFPGMTIVEQTRRCYPLGTTAAHIVGYLGIHDQDSKKENTPHLAGKTGVEKVFEASLKGHPGEQREQTDWGGHILSTKTIRETQHGQTLKLTIDSRLQQTAEALLDQAILRRSYTGAKPEHVGGAAVVMDVHTGEILVAASSPCFNPNWFVPGAENRSDQIREAMTAPDKPMFNRVAQMALPPGSVFKIITAAAALESGIITPSTTYRCHGFMESENAYRCQIYKRYKEGHGPVQLTDALGQSCNTYFFHLADMLGAKPILDWAVRFGLGQRTRIALPGESAGELPPLLLQQEDLGTRPINARFLAIGQERLRTTPLQIARLLAAVANGGQLLQPHLVDIESNKDVPAINDRTETNQTIPQLHRETLTALRRGLEATVASPRGTTYDQNTNAPEDESDPAATPIHIAGKTGTAQSGGSFSDHAWFAAYAPAATPRYVVVVVLEHAGNSSESAVPVVRRIFTKMQQLELLP